MIKSIGTSGCVIELVKLASGFIANEELIKDEYSAEDIRRIKEIAWLSKDLGSKKQIYGRIDNIYPGAIAEIETIERLKNNENLEGILFNNVHLKNVQIDHILVGTYGVAVIDSKKRTQEIAKGDIEIIREQMDKQANAVYNYVTKDVAIKKQVIKKFVALYSRYEVNDSIFLRDLGKISEYLQEKVINREDAERIQRVIRAVTVRRITKPDLWGKIKYVHSTDAETGIFYVK